MSWDVLILRSDGTTPIHELPKDWRPDPLGDADELRDRLARFFGSLDWSDPAWGILEGNGFSLEFNFTKSGLVDSFMLHVRGGGDAVSPIVAMCKHFCWQALDCSSGDFIDLTNPSTEGWERFQAYRDKVFGRSHGGSAG